MASASAWGERTMVAPRAAPVSSATGPCLTTRPLWMTTTSLTVWAISDRTWLDTSTVRPCAAVARNMSRSQRIPAGSRPLAGSSRTRIFGSPSSAAARPMRWRMPIEYLP